MVVRLDLPTSGGSRVTGKTKTSIDGGDLVAALGLSARSSLNLNTFDR
jgi:hypothetical protein